MNSSKDSDCPVEHPDVQLEPLPFYDIKETLLAPSSLVPKGKLPYMNIFQFELSPAQAHDIGISKRGKGSAVEFRTKVIVRFCLLEQSSQQQDIFPDNLFVAVNENSYPLPNQAASQQGLDRIGHPLDITSHCFIATRSVNTVTASWTPKSDRSYVMAIYLAKKLDSAILLSRLRARGPWNRARTLAMIQENFSANLDSDIFIQNPQFTLICSLEKKKMNEPCRSRTCAHVLCFEAKSYIQMNEVKPKWICPICDKLALFEDLVIDELFLEVTTKTAPTVRAVQFHKDGSWLPIDHESENDSITDEEGEDGRPIKKPKVAPEVLDLISSDDDDEEEDDSSSSNAVTPAPYVPPVNVYTGIPLTDSGLFPNMPHFSMSSTTVSALSYSNPPQEVCAPTSVPEQNTDVLQEPAPTSSAKVQEWFNDDYELPYTNSPSSMYDASYSFPTDFGSSAASHSRSNSPNLEFLDFFSGSNA